MDLLGISLCKTNTSKDVFLVGSNGRQGGGDETLKVERENKYNVARLKTIRNYYVDWTF